MQGSKVPSRRRQSQHHPGAMHDVPVRVFTVRMTVPVGRRDRVSHSCSVCSFSLKPCFSPWLELPNLKQQEHPVLEGHLRGLWLSQVAVSISGDIGNTWELWKMLVEIELISFGVQFACGDTKNLWVILWRVKIESYSSAFPDSSPSLTVINFQGNYNKPFLMCL